MAVDKNQTPSRAHLFSSTNQPKNRGRKKSVFTEVMKKSGLHKKVFGYSLDDAVKFDQLILVSTSDQLKELAQSEGIPFSIQSEIKAIINDMNEGKTTTIDKIRRRHFGDEIKKVDITTAGESLNPIDISVLSEEEKDALLELRMKIEKNARR